MLLGIFFNGYEVGIDAFILFYRENIRYKTEFEKDNTPWVFVQEHWSNNIHACTEIKVQAAFKLYKTENYYSNSLLGLETQLTSALPSASLQRLRSPRWVLPFQNSASWQWCQIWCPSNATSTQCMSCSLTNLVSLWLSIQVSLSIDSFLSCGRKDLAQSGWVIIGAAHTNFLVFCS